MSWLTTQMERRRKPYPVAPLAEALGLRLDDPHLTGRLALHLDMNRGWVRRCRRLGLTAEQADVWAARAGLPSSYVWPAIASDLRGAALINANKLACPHGGSYTWVDAEGARRCSCRKILVNTQVSGPNAERAPLALFTPPMAERHGNRERLNTNLPPDVSRRIDELRKAAGLSRSAWACMKLTEAVRAADEAGEREDVAS